MRVRITSSPRQLFNKRDIKGKLNMKRCSKCETPVEADHLCAYLSDVESDRDTLCDCCDGCADLCAQDI